MDSNQLGGQLFALTGSLQATGPTGAADLQRARAALAATIQAGAATDSRPVAIASGLQQSSDIRFSQLSPDTRKQFSAVNAGPAQGFLSNSPVADSFSPSTPAWARGMALEVLGPFQDSTTGMWSWVHIIFPFPEAVTLLYGGQVVAALTILGAPTAGKNDYSLVAGSVWIDSQLLASGSPASSWTGFRIKSGALKLGSHSVSGSQITLNAPGNFTIQADLDPQSAPPPVTGPGADSSLVTVTLPTSVTIDVEPSGTTISAPGKFSATVYGFTLALKRNADQPSYSTVVNGIFVPCEVSPSDFAFASVRSTLFQPAGTASIKAAGWVLPVAVTTPDKLGKASGAGEIGLALGSGMNVSWSGGGASVDAIDASLVAAPGGLGVIVRIASSPGAESWNLWDGKLRPSTMAFTVPAGGFLFYTAVPGVEQVFAGGSVVVHADRPVEATGLGVPVAMPVATMTLLQTKALPSGIVLVEGAAPLKPHAQASAFALENAFIEALPPQLLIAGGTLHGSDISRGVMLLYFGMNAFVPTLPDPYATNATLIGNPPGRGDFDAPITPTPIGTLLAGVVWLAPSTPVLSFELLFPQGSANLGQFHQPVDSSTIVDRGSGVSLLDVSSKANQFGVNWNPDVLTNIPSDNLFLTSDGIYTSLFTVSAISWEQMVADDPVPSPPIPIPSVDGIPSVLSVPTVKLAPIAPLPLMHLQHESVALGNPISYFGNLPFGMVAEVQNDKAAQYNFVRPAFGAYLGGHQISLIAGNPTSTKPEFAGQTVLTPYGQDVLGTDVSLIFQGDFGSSGAEPGVPVQRYDLSGYGATLFSEWADPDVQGTGILKVQFTVWVGRTAYEVVKAQSIIYPWGIRIVRTITMQRVSGGAVVRTDSGWQAATPGTFVFPPHSTANPTEFNNSVHAGPVKGVYNVRNIRDNGAPFSLDGNTYAPMLFDADVLIHSGNPVVSGAFQTSYVPSKNITGYAQLLPDNSPATRSALANLLQKRGPANGPVACTVNVGKAGQRMKVGSVQVSSVGSGETAVFVASLQGTPVLPRDGQWSMGVKKGSGAPLALDAQTAVPLVQPNGSSIWYFAEPSDILTLPAQVTQYGFLQGTSTQKSFFGSPQISQGANNVSIPNPPHIADVGALLGATGIFPDLAKALQFPSPQNLLLGALGDDTLTLNSLPSFPVTQPPLTLVDFGAISVVLDYHDRSTAGNPATMVTFNLDPTADPRWSIDFAKFTFVLVTPFGDFNDPLLLVVGAAHADADSAPTLKDLTVLYGSILSLVQSIFSKLDELASFLPGNKSYLDVSLSDGQLTIQDKFALPTLPLGLGDITNVALVLGATMTISPLGMDFTAGISSPDEPFQWLVSPLSGTGCVQVGFQNNDATILIQAGIGVGLAIDVGIAEGSASIVLGFQVDNTVKPFELKVILTGQASVDVLGGLASASLMLSAALAIIPALPEITFVGSVAVGIHISICWVVNIDFDGSWQFSQSVTA